MSRALELAGPAVYFLYVMADHPYVSSLRGGCVVGSYNFESSLLDFLPFRVLYLYTNSHVML
jgi:hypothetical protein